jgi:hypothetical protein
MTPERGEPQRAHLIARHPAPATWLARIPWLMLGFAIAGL